MFAFHCLFSWMMTTVVVPICTHMSTTIVIYQYLHPLPMYFICELETTSWIVYNSCAPSISAGKTLVQGQEGTLRLSVEIPSLRGNLGWLVAVLFRCTLTFKQNRGRCDGEAPHPRLKDFAHVVLPKITLAVFVHCGTLGECCCTLSVFD